MAALNTTLFSGRARPPRVGWCALLSALLAGVAHATTASVTVHSPDRHLEARVEVSASTTRLRIRRDSLAVATIGLGLLLESEPALASHWHVDAVTRRAVDAWHTRAIGKSNHVHEHYHAIELKLRESVAPARRLLVTVRVYDDGVAFRYTLPVQPALAQFALKEELTRFVFDPNARAYALPLGFGSSYEGRYRIAPLTELIGVEPMVLPLLLRLPDGVLVGVTEAQLTNYAGLYLAANATLPGTLLARLAPTSDDKGRASPITVRGSLPFESPWRVLMVGSSEQALLESSLVWLLNDPPNDMDFSWVHPGKVQFPWWNGYYFPPDARLPPAALDTATLKRYITFCAENHIPLHSIDGYNFDYAWYGGPVSDPVGADVTKPIAAIDMPAVLEYARSKGVRTRLWVHADGLKQRLDEALDTYERWGIEGIMVDFINRDDQPTVQWVNEVVRKAAAHHLTVNFHGIYKPTGLERTWPNLLGHEAVFGQEYNKWDERGSDPDHEMLLPFVRGLAGSFDVHQGSFTPTAPASFHPHFIRPSSIGTLSRQLAMYVVYDNPLAMLADAPSAYLAEPAAFALLRRIPTTWDETRVLEARIGLSIAIARRSGETWYVGVMNGSAATTLRLNLSFLGANHYSASIVSDAEVAPYTAHGYRIEERELTRTQSLLAVLPAAGGYLVELRPRR